MKNLQTLRFNKLVPVASQKWVSQLSEPAIMLDLIINANIFILNSVMQINLWLFRRELVFPWPSVIPAFYTFYCSFKSFVMFLLAKTYFSYVPLLLMWPESYEYSSNKLNTSAVRLVNDYWIPNAYQYLVSSYLFDPVLLSL